MEFKVEGNALFNAGKLEEALVAYRKGIDSYDNRAEDENRSAATDSCLHILYSNSSMIHLKLCMVDEALQDAALAIEEKPDFAKAHLRMAAVLNTLFKFEDAAKSIKVAEA